MTSLSRKELYSRFINYKEGNYRTDLYYWLSKEFDYLLGKVAPITWVDNFGIFEKDVGFQWVMNSAISIGEGASADAERIYRIAPLVLPHSSITALADEYGYDIDKYDKNESPSEYNYRMFWLAISFGYIYNDITLEDIEQGTRKNIRRKAKPGELEALFKEGK